MIPDVVAVVFLLVPWACLVYIFRGVTSDANPIWGNVLASGISCLICAMATLWFLSGTIVSPSIVSNATYQIPTDLTIGEMLEQQAAASNTSNKLETGGAGMFSRAAISLSSGGNITNETTINVHTYDIIYQQYQDYGMMFLYALLAIVSGALFLWFLADARQALREQIELEDRSYEDY